jgi:type II secretory pathway pseudopilin PulG
MNPTGRAQRRKPFSEWVARARAQEGFTLVEAVVAIGLLGLILSGLALTTGGSLKSVRETKRYQQATAIGNLGVEDARNRAFSDLVLTSSTLTGDPRITGPAGSEVFDADGTKTAIGNEPIVQATSGGLAHTENRTVDGATYTLFRYITWVDDTTTPGTQDYKRYLIRVEWQIHGSTRSYETSTFLTPVRRGLPLPKFEVTPLTLLKEVERGVEVIFTHEIHNQGIVDTYDVDFDVPAGHDWDVELYRESNGNDTFQVSGDTALTDTNANTTLDTGSVALDQRVRIYAVWTIPDDEPYGDTIVAATVTSGADTSVEAEIDDTVRVQPPGIVLYLWENPHPPTADKNATANLPMSPTGPPTTGTLYRYSNDLDASTPGRVVDKSSPSDTQSSTALMVNWVYQVPNDNTAFSGDGEVRVWVRREGADCSKSYTVRGYLRHKAASTDNASNTTLIETLSDTTKAPISAATCNYEEMVIPFTVSPQVNVAKNRWIELKLVVLGSSSGKLGLAYDTAAYPSTIRLPQVSG